MDDRVKRDASSYRDSRIVWFISIIFSAAVAVLVEGLLSAYPSTGNLLSKILGPVVKDLFPYLVFVLVGINWWLIWNRLGRILIKFYGLVRLIVLLILYHVLFGFIAATFTWLLGASSERIVLIGLLAGFIWIALSYSVLLILILSWVRRKRCPKCGSDLEYDHTGDLIYGFYNYISCTNENCDWSDVELATLTGLPR